MSQAEEIKEKAKALVQNYESELTTLGIQCSLSQKYHEEDVQHAYNSQSAFLGEIERKANEKKEREKYFYQRNKYKILVLTFSPLSHNDKKDFRQYAFYVERTTRAHLGQEPEHIVTKEEKLLKRIELRIQKFISQAKKKGAEATCKNGFTDALRYTNSNKYLYKDTILGRSRGFWDGMCVIACIVALFIILGIAAIIFY